MTEDNDLFAPAEFREHQEGYGERDPDARPHAGIVRDADVSRYLAVLDDVYDPATYAERPDELPGHAQDLEEVRGIRAVEATETARVALDAGDAPTLAHLKGNADRRADVSGLKAIQKLKSFVTGPAAMFYLWAEPGTGKTNFALLVAELWKRAHGGDALLASNIRTLRETDEWTDDDGERRDGWLSSFGELQEWIEQDGDPLQNDQRPKLFVFDEASSSAGGGGSSGYETKEKMGPLAYKIRKYGGALIVIGHDGKDVHPLIREMGVAVHKESKKRAVFYDDVKNRSGVGERLAVDGIPPTDYRYDDKEPTAWSWSRYTDDGEEEMDAGEFGKDVAIYTAIRAREEGLTERDTAKFVPYSHGWVGSRYREYKNDGEHEETLSKVRELIA